MLWLCLNFPELPLEIFQRGSSSREPLAIGGTGNPPRIIACNSAASSCGVKQGITVSAAYALTGNLTVLARDENREAAALEKIAMWAGQFTPTISIARPSALLLEIQGSLKLFGGFENLLSKVKTGIEELGYTSDLASAPTPAGALLLARSGLELYAADHETLKNHLLRLSIEVLDYEETAIESLGRMGIYTLGDCLRLPRDGLARRFGQGLLDEIDRALGGLPDPRESFAAPEKFSSTLELPYPVPDVEPLLFGVKRVVCELGGFLASRNAGVMKLAVQLKHEDHPVTKTSFGLSMPSRDTQHLLALLRERFSSVSLADRVVSLTLTAEETAQLAPRNFSLFGDKQRTKENRLALVERLRARLGENAVSGLQLYPDHRPELAWRESEPGTEAIAIETLVRPVWLLHKPRQLAVDGGSPVLNGPLTLLSGPERIESGWWDGFDIARDYFIAASGEGAKYWIYRERQGDPSWYLHGIFS